MNDSPWIVSYISIFESLIIQVKYSLQIIKDEQIIQQWFQYQLNTHIVEMSASGDLVRATEANLFDK